MKHPKLPNQQYNDKYTPANRNSNEPFSRYRLAIQYSSWENALRDISFNEYCRNTY